MNTKTTRPEGARNEETLCVLVPCANGEALVQRAVEEVLRHADRIPLAVQVVMIDNGSTDGTRAAMERLCREDDRCRFIAHDAKRGLGRCVAEAHGTLPDDVWVTVFPADSEFVFAESIDSLLAARHGNDVVLGYLYNSVVRTLRRRIVSTGFLKLTKTIYGFRWHSLNGMKLYRAGAFKGISLVSGGHAYVAELLAKAQLRRPDLRIAEAPFVSRGKLGGDSRGIDLRSIVRAIHETYRGAQDVARYRETMVGSYLDEPEERESSRETFFPPATRD